MANCLAAIPEEPNRAYRRILKTIHDSGADFVVGGVAAAATVAVVVGGGLLGKCGEHREVATPQGALHTNASPNQGCKCCD